MAGIRQEAVRLELATDKWLTYEGLHFQCEAPEGSFWFTSEDSGVVRFDGEAWVRYGADDGLMDVPHQLLATRKDVTGLPFGVKRISGSLPRLPMMVIRFTLTIAPNSFGRPVYGTGSIRFSAQLDQQVAYDVLRYPEVGLQFTVVLRPEPEPGQDVRALGRVLDRVGQAPLAPAVNPHDGATLVRHVTANSLHRVFGFLVAGIRPDYDGQLVVRECLIHLILNVLSCHHIPQIRAQ